MFLHVLIVVLDSYYLLKVSTPINNFASEMHVLWYTQFLKRDDFERDDIVIYRINPFYDLEDLREDIQGSLDFYFERDVD